jgi:hypothetical protein
MPEKALGDIWKEVPGPSLSACQAGHPRSERELHPPPSEGKVHSLRWPKEISSVGVKTKTGLMFKSHDAHLMVLLCLNPTPIVAKPFRVSQ